MPLSRHERKNMQLKKIAIVFLVVIMMFSLAAIGIAAEEAGSELSLSAKFESEKALSALKPGDTVNLVVRVDSNPGDLKHLEVRVDYDVEDVEFLGIDPADYGVIFEKDDSKTQIRPFAKAGLVQIWCMANEGFESSKTGAYYTFRFKVSDSFDGDLEGVHVSFASYKLADDKNFTELHVHTYGAGKAVAGDCKHEGATVYECTDPECDNKLSVSTGKLGDHNYGDLIPAVEPTKKSEGNVAHYKCSICSKYFDADKNEIDSPVLPKIEGSNVVTIIIIVVAVLVLAGGAAAAVLVLKKKKII